MYNILTVCVYTSGSVTGSGTVSMASPSTRGGKKLPVKVIEKWKEGIEGAESPLNRIRQRIVHFLGALGGQVNTSLVESESAAAYAAKAVAWDSKSRLEFAVPFQDMKPTLYLGECSSDLAHPWVYLHKKITVIIFATMRISSLSMHVYRSFPSSYL